MGSRLLGRRWCNSEGLDTSDSYPEMSQALARHGRPIVFIHLPSGVRRAWLWPEGIGQLWRATGDIQDCWDCGKSWGGMGVVHIIDLMADIHAYSGPGHWNDTDMPQVANGGLTFCLRTARTSASGLSSRRRSWPETTSRR